MARLFWFVRCPKCFCETKKHKFRRILNLPFLRTISAGNKEKLEFFSGRQFWQPLPFVQILSKLFEFVEGIEILAEKFSIPGD